MVKKVSAAGAVLGAAMLAGGGFVWAVHEGKVELVAATDQIRAQVGPDGSFSYTTSEVHPFSRTVELGMVALRTADGALYTADQVIVSSGGANRISKIHAERIRLVVAENPKVLTAVYLDGTDIILPPGIAGQPARLNPAAVVFKDLTIHGMTSDVPGPAGTIGMVEIANYGAGRASTMSIQDLRAPIANAATADRIGVAKVVMVGVDLASVVDAICRSSAMPQLPAASMSFEADGFYVANGADKSFEVGKSLVRVSVPVGGATSKNVISFSGVTIRPWTVDLRTRMADAGMTDIKGSLSIASNYASEGGRFELSDMNARVDGVGTLGISLRLIHLGHADIHSKVNLAQIMAMAQNIKLTSASVYFTDSGFLDKSVALHAKEGGAAESRSHMVAEVNANAAFALLPFGDQIQKALASFIGNGGTLRVGIQPDVPMSVLDLARGEQSNPVALIEQLGLTMSNDKTASPVVDAKF